jgi:hypothetical protein
MGIGQVLNYEDTLLARGHTVQPVLYLEERPPTRAGAPGATARHPAHLPGTEHSLLNP